MQSSNKPVWNEESEINGMEENPPTIIQTDTSESCSLTSSIGGINEFGMISAKKGNETTFCIVVKEQLFQKIKFQKIGNKHGIQLGSHVNLWILMVAL